MGSGSALELDLSIGGFAICPPGSGVLSRVINDYELVWVVEGSATWICDGTTHSAPADTVILVRPGMRDAFRWDPIRASRVAYLHFEVRKGLRGLPPPERWPRLIRLGRDDMVQPLFRQIVRLSEERPGGWEAVAHSAACHLLCSIVTRTHETSLDGEGAMPDAVERALVFVRQEWERQGRCTRVSVDQLCTAAAVSPRHLSRVFREAFGAAPAHVLRLARLEIAADLLGHTDLTLEKIADYTGFANAFHLSRAFKSAHGVAPRALRGRSGSRHRPSAASPQARRLVGKLLPRSLA